MSDLRWILLIFGILLIIGIYLYGLFSGRSKRTDDLLRRNMDTSTPHFGDGLDDDEMIEHLSPEPAVASELNYSFQDSPEQVDLELADLTDLIREAVNESKESFPNSSISSEPASEVDAQAQSDDNTLIPLINGNIIVINLLPRGESELFGPDLLNAFSKLNIVYGDMHIFHFFESGQRLFSVANLVEPGTFEPESMLEFKTKGISLFMQLKDLIKPVASFERMLEIVWELANELKTDICDIKCETMTPQTATQLMDAVKYYESKVY